ncbi:hypothetical protein ACH5RR_016777 [Cinchona calisaya]|uniref:Flocculation protein n=1 Tax=Cinchona calisaya TaxID=153742 RepID=A0ABD2ZY48_9GENT
MVNSEKQQSLNDRNIDDVEDCSDRSNGGGDCSNDSTSTAGASTSVIRSSSSTSRGSALTSENVAEDDGDLLLQQSDRVDNLLQWLRALDVHVMGACRADERLKPLLKLNASTGAAEDRLLAHLSQHFEPSEVGMLARCLCVPLVSIRVGKINKLGSLLCPTATRGNLNLTLLPTSDMRISFTGDDGSTERLVTLTSETRCSAVEIEEILADKSGRSFYIKISNDESFYYWCSEKSKLLGIELLRKMKDLLKRKPFLADLTGISKSRLESFAIHLRSYLIGSTMTNAYASSVVSLSSSLDASVESSEIGFNLQSSVGSLKTSRSRQNVGQGAKTSPLYQGSLSPRPSSFKGVARNLASIRSVAGERLQQRGDSYVSCINNLAVPSARSPNAPSSNCSEDKLQGAGTHLFPPSSFLESLGNFVVGNPVLGSSDQVSSVGSSLFSPHYCWCPPVSPTQYTRESAQFPTPSSDLLSLPTSLLSVTKSSSLLLTAMAPLNLAEVPSLDFPPLLPEPLVKLPLSIPASQQIPTFTPLICDPIVHIPVIDICSSGQGYWVTAGPAISTAIQPMRPNLVSPLIPEADSVVEKSARETLRLLINNSNQPNPPLMDVLPSVLSHGNEMQNILAAGSRGLYCGTRDVDAIASSISAIGFVSPADRFVHKRCISRGNQVDEIEKSDGSSECTSGDVFPKSWDEKVD